VTCSLWLVPPEPLCARLATLVADLALRLGTVAFAPHVTLLGGIEAPEDALPSAAGSLAARLRPIEMRLGAVTLGSDFYRCVFVEVAGTPELLRAHALARECFTVAPGETFRPHLSLVYGHLGEAQKEAARADAGGLGSAFIADTLYLMETSGDVAGWRRLGSYALRG
jgi:hypothetical protein